MGACHRLSSIGESHLLLTFALILLTYLQSVILFRCVFSRSLLHLPFDSISECLSRCITLALLLWREKMVLRHWTCMKKYC